MTRQELEILKNKEEYIDTFVKPFRQEARVKLYPMAMKILALEEKLENLKKAIKKSKKDRENELQKLTQELTTTITNFGNWWDVVMKTREQAQLLADALNIVKNAII